MSKFTKSIATHPKYKTWSSVAQKMVLIYMEKLVYTLWEELDIMMHFIGKTSSSKEIQISFVLLIPN